MPEEINTKSLEDKINQLNMKAWEVRVSDSTLAYTLSKEAAELAGPINYVKGTAEALRTLGFCHIRLSKHREALAYLERALTLLESLNNLHGQSDVYEYFGIIKRSLGDYKASLNFLFKSLELRQEIGYKEGKSLSLYHLGVTYKYLGNYEQALEYFLKSLSIARVNNFWIPESYSLNNIGLIYSETGDYKKALEYLYQSLAIRRKGGDKWGEAGCLDNIGVNYFKMKNHEKAIDFHNQSLKISELTGDQKGRSNSVFHLGNNYDQLNEFDKALDCYNRSLQIRRQIGDIKGEAEVFLFIAEIYAKDDFDGQNISKAFELMNDALKLANEIEAGDLLVKIHYGLYQVCKKNNLIETALMHLESYINVQRQVHSDAINKKIMNIEIEQYEKQIIELEAKALRAQMNPHFIFNCMNSIKALIQNDDKVRSIKYLTTFSKLIRTLFQNSDKRQISLFDEIETCRLYIQLEEMRLNGNLKYNFFIDANLDLKSVMVPALIVQPFIENAIWHGIVPRNMGSITLNIKGNEEVIICEIDDDGIGREMSKLNKPITPVIHESKGVRLSQDRLNLEKKLNDTNASIEIIDKYDNTVATGTKVILKFNLN